VSLSGRIGKPLLTLHGTLDALLPIRTDSDVYDRMIRAAGRGSLHRYYRIEGGGHVDGRYDVHPTELRPILPCYRAAFVAFEAMIERGAAPPPDQTVARTVGGDIANKCPLQAARRCASPARPNAPGAVAARRSSAACTGAASARWCGSAASAPRRRACGSCGLAARRQARQLAA
jgi:hypothetical protein